MRRRLSEIINSIEGMTAQESFNSSDPAFTAVLEELRDHNAFVTERLKELNEIFRV